MNTSKGYSLHKDEEYIVLHNPNAGYENCRIYAFTHNGVDWVEENGWKERARKLGISEDLITKAKNFRLMPSEEAIRLAKKVLGKTEYDDVLNGARIIDGTLKKYRAAVTHYKSESARKMERPPYGV